MLKLSGDLKLKSAKYCSPSPSAHSLSLDPSLLSSLFLPLYALSAVVSSLSAAVSSLSAAVSSLSAAISSLPTSRYSLPPPQMENEAGSNQPKRGRKPKGLSTREEETTKLERSKTLLKELREKKGKGVPLDIHLDQNGMASGTDSAHWATWLGYIGKDRVSVKYHA